MNVSSRKTNPSYKRDPNAIHFTSHPHSPGNLHDGMSYPGSNSLSLQPTAAPVTVQPANAPLSQHASQYLQGNSVPLAHPSTYHIATHVPVTSTQTIQIQTHSQGPTPSSTPPTVPNDSKGSHQYPQHNFATMNHYPVRPMQSPFIMSNARNHGGSRGVVTPRQQLFYLTNGTPQYFVPQPLQAALTGQMNGGNLIQSQYPIASSTSPEQHSLYYSSLPPTPSTQPFSSNYQTSRPHWQNQSRTPQQGAVPLQSHTSMLPNNPIYSNISTVPIASQQTQPPQQQPQQQPTHIQSTRTKRRSNAVAIIDPNTLQEVNVDGDNDANDEQSAKSKETMEAENRTRNLFSSKIKEAAQEPSSRSIPSTQSPASSSTNLKELATSGSMNGAPTPVAPISQPITIVAPPPTTDRKSSSQPTSTTNNLSASTISDSNVSSNKVDPATASASSFKPSATLPAAVSSSKMDYKRPTREESQPHQQPAAASIEPTTAASTVVSAVTGEGSKLRQSAPAWQETPSALSKVVPTVPASGPTKKQAKESETSGSGSSSTLGSSLSSTAAAPASSVTAAPTVAGQDAAHKISAVTTSSSIVVEDNACTVSASKGGAPSKQGIQNATPASSVGVSQLVEEVASVPKSTASAKPAVSTPNVPLLPQATSVPTTTPGNVSAVVIGKSKQKGGVPSSRDPSLPTPSVAAAGSSDAVSAPSAAAAAALSTGSSSAEKSTAISAAQPPATSVASQAPGSRTATPTRSQSSAYSEDDRKVTVVAKEEKPINPPQKQGRNRGGSNKEVPANDNAADSQASSGAKNKSAQSASKHHAADGSKSTSSNTQSSTANKQSNGETAEPATENKMSSSKKKKNKKESNKKNSEKDNVDVDGAVDKAPPLAEKNRGGNSEKASQQQQPAQQQPQPSQNAAENASNSSSNASSRKANSSQKSAAVTATSASTETKDNASIVTDSKEKVQIQQNIPVVPKLPATQAHSSNKTESITIEQTSNGKKKYTVSEILAYRDLPQCKLPVKLKPDVSAMVDAARFQGASRSMSQNGYSAANSFMPSFAHPHPHQAPPRMSMGGSGRKSQQGMRRDRPPQPIHVSLSLKDDVPLRQSKDAWKPTRLNQDRSTDDETKKTEALNKAVRGILNKLTPEKFPTLIEKINSLPIDNSSRLEGVIDLIFQKAIDEPGFCRWYAEMCRVMQTLSVINEATNTNETFRKILLNKCQNEFQREKAAEMDSEKRLAEIKACNDPEKKKELQSEFEDMERKMRRKSVGNCRFIGELFKLQMLTAKIMIRCVAQLLSNLEEESLECLCKLLTTIGKDLEMKLGPSGPIELDKFFSQMQDIINDKKNKVSSRIRFMLQDVIDLRRNKWVPRREADNPKTIDQMNQEFERKEQDIKLANMLPRGGGGKQYDDYGRNRDFKKNPKNDKDEWQTVTNKSNFNSKSNNQKIDQGKLQSLRTIANANVVESLGPQINHMAWRFGASSGSKSTGSGSMHSMQSLSARSSVSSKLTPSNSTEKPRPFAMPRDDEAKMSRSSSSQNVRPISREGSAQRVPSSRNASQSSTVSSAPPQVEKEVLERFCKTILEEFALNNSEAESIVSFEERINPQQINDALECFVNIVLEKTKLSNTCGRLFAALFKRKLISLSNILDMLSSLIEISEDILIDCPRLWDYLAETLCPLFIEDCLKYSEFETSFVGKLPEQRGGPFLLAVKDLLNKHEVSKKPSISEYLTKNIDSESFENMKVWINKNVGKSQDNPELVRALTRAVCENLHSRRKDLTDDKFLKIFNEKFFRYFKFYVENKEDLEMICLGTVADFARERDFPSGFILNMCKSLHDSKCVSPDSFLSWRGHYQNHPMSGVVFTSLTQFFHSIEE